MRYLVTGGAGFIGSHLSDHLLTLGHEVIVIDNLSTGSRENLDLAFNYDSFRFVEGDVCDSELVDELLKGVEAVFHLAATVGVEKVCCDTGQTFNNNCLGTKVILNKALRHNCKVVYASTSEVYGDKVSAMKESDPCSLHVTHRGRSAYTLSKLLGEFDCLTMQQDFGLPAVVCRLFNTIGPRQKGQYGMVVPRFIEKAQTDAEIPVYGDGKQTRAFCSVYDTVDALFQLSAQVHTSGEIFNVGNDQPIEIGELAHYIKAINGSSSRIKKVCLPKERDDDKDIKHRRPSLAKINEFIGWRPSRPWKEAVNDANEYYLSPAKTDHI